MSRNHIPLIRVLIPAASIACIFLALSLQETAPRAPASPAKLATIQEALQKPGASLKMRQSVEVTVDLLEDYRQGLPFTLKATVTADKEFSDLQYKWHLGPGVQVLSGALSGTFSKIAPGEPQVVQLTLQKTSGFDPAKAFLHVSYKEGSGRFTQIGRFSSQRQFHGISSGPKPEKKKYKMPDGMKVIY